MSDLEEALCNRGEQVVSKGNRIRGNVNSSKSYLAVILGTKFVPAVAAPASAAVEKALIFDSEKRRTDKQIGSRPESSGTTSLAVKGGGPAIIGWAIENGAA